MARSGCCQRTLFAGACVLTWISARPATAVEITAIETVALSTDTAPGAGGPYTLFSRSWLNDAGELLFYGTVSGGAAGLWWWAGSGDESAVAVTGTDAPELGPAQLASIDSGDTWAGARGPAFFGTLAAGGGFGNESLWRQAGATPTLLAIEDDAAPGTTADFQSITENVGELGVNDLGEFAFLAGLSDGTTAVFGPDGIGGTRLLQRGGEPAPGTTSAVFAAPDDLALAGDGSTVLEAYLQTGVGGTIAATDRGIWGTAGYGPLQLVARRGDRPAGLAAGARFEAFQRWEVNGSGEVVLGATYFPPSSGVAEDRLWHHDLHTGVTSLLLRKGDIVEIAPGDPRTVSFITAGLRASGGEDGKRQAWNDARQLAAALGFSDASRGVFRITVPEPASGAAGAAVAALGVLARRRPPT